MISQAEFLRRFLHQACENESYWVTTSLPLEVLEKVTATVKDELGFEAHRDHFDLLDGIIDECVTEYVEAMKRKDYDVQNTLKHPRILALANFPGDQRAGVICAAAQGMRWIDEIQPWINGHTLQNEIAKRTLIGVLRCFSKKKQCFSATDLKVLVRLGGSIQGQDSFGIIAQMAIVEILATNVASLTTDNETKALLPPYLDHVAARSGLAYVVKAINKLRSKLNTN
jgi:hypothetical protein